MSPQEFSSALLNIEFELEKTREERTRVIVHNALDAISSRVINRGVDSEGNSFPPYSKNPLPTFFFLTGKLGKKKTTRSDENKAVKDFVKQYGRQTSYENWREFHGLPTDKKNFSFTNEMWKSTIVSLIQDGPEETVWGISSNNPADLKILLIHHAKHGILFLSEHELDVVLQANQDRITSIIDHELNRYV